MQRCRAKHYRANANYARQSAEQNITEQTQTMLDKVEALLEQAGSSKKHMLSATIYVKSMEYFADMNAPI